MIPNMLLLLLVFEYYSLPYYGVWYIVLSYRSTSREILER